MLIVVTLVLILFTNVVNVVTVPALVPTVLLNVFRFVLVVTKELLTARTAPLLGIFVSRDPSPICCP